MRDSGQNDTGAWSVLGAGEGSAARPGGAARGAGDAANALALELTGGLPCVRCRYDLRGLSVRGVCPECGTAIRATILARVDPLARELQPVYTPKLTAGLLVLWTLAALGAAVAAWVPRVVEALGRLEYALRQPDWPGVAVAVGAALSGVGAAGLIRPQRGVRRRTRVLAAVGVGLYVPLCWAIAHVYQAFDARDPDPYLGPRGIDPARAAWRLLIDGLLLGIVLALRPSARVLTARSFVLRTGRVDRQTMLAMAAAIGVCAIGDGLAVAGGSLGATGSQGVLADMLRIGAMLFVGVGSLLVTLGLAGMLLDAVRLVPVVAERPLDLADITRPEGAIDPPGGLAHRRPPGGAA